MKNNTQLHKHHSLGNNPNNELNLPTMYNIYESKFLSDCKILNNSTKTEFNSHKILLCLHSKYFYEVISDTEKAKTQLNNNSSDNLIIPLVNEISTNIKSEINSDAEMDLILKFIYNNGDFNKISQGITVSNSVEILSLCKSLGIDSLAEKISHHVTSNFLTKENSLKFYLDSIKLEDKNLEQKTFKLVTKNFPNLNKNLTDIECFLEFSYETFLNFVTQDDLVMETEKDISELILNFIKSRRNLPENVANLTNTQVNPEMNKDKQYQIKAEMKDEIEEEKSKAEDIEEKQEESEQSKEEEEESEEDKKEESEEIKEDRAKDEIKENNNNLVKETNFNSRENVIKKVLDKWNDRVAQSIKKFEKRRLTSDEEKKLIESIRFSHLSHSDLISFSIDPLMSQYKDLILLGLSFRLNAYENTNKIENLDKNINYNPRKYLKDQNIYLGNYRSKNKNKLIDNSNFSQTNKSNEKDKKSLNQNHNNSQRLRYNDNDFSHSQNNFNIKDYRGNQTSQNHLRSKSNFNYEPLLEFNYNYDFDENGVFYYLGTLGKTSNYKNPHLIQQAKAFCSSLGKGNMSDLIGRDLVNLRTLNEPYSFFGVDLGEDRYLIPSAYTIKNRNSSSHVMFNWVLEGSNDKINFEVLDSRNFKSNDLEVDSKLERDRCQLKMPGCTSTWFINKNIVNKCPKGFRYFIIKQTDKNSSGSFNLALSGFELYGTGIGFRWKF